MVWYLRKFTRKGSKAPVAHAGCARTQIKTGSDEGRAGDWADITLRPIGSNNGVRSTVDLLIDCPWKRERLIRQQAIPADNIRTVRLSVEKQIPPPAFVAPSKCARKMLLAFLSTNESKEDKVVSRKIEEEREIEREREREREKES